MFSDSWKRMLKIRHILTENLLTDRLNDPVQTHRDYFPLCLSAPGEFENVHSNLALYSIDQRMHWNKIVHAASSTERRCLRFYVYACACDLDRT